MRWKGIKNRRKKNIEYQLDIERKDALNPSISGYDFIYPLGNLLSLDEQKIKTEELTEITKIKKKDGSD